MKYSRATNYALHTMVYLMSAPRGKTVGVDQLAKAQDLSPTYLSKILTKLVKAGLIESTPGVKGGYSIARNSSDISFLDVIQAIEGMTTLFSCSMEHQESRNGECMIENVMIDAEEKLREELDKKYISEIAKQMEAKREEKNRVNHSH
ncbi:Rrf2 family transcriptional regulator [Sediminibacillus dalangtanensis]|uniref:Rrf2 family transcriptional regulator n=1 Tax=Sediminibacillus dalangtanensis TaxID=2729421 RepID=A0ABX7VP36_9BACI|nr:Rrf2 family transcriptional regulator [Sediminibacillus dalangtanensis]QTM98223.1 Rrf2 family transcriptional regulator [Sediminibacillus dalangtanensis]